MSLDSDYLDPADLDWPTVADATLAHAARAGIPRAVAEAARRNSAEIKDLKNLPGPPSAR